MTAAFALTNATIFDGVQVHERSALLVKDGRLEVISESALPAATPQRSAEGAWIIPGLLDLQVNGGGGVMFNDDPTPATLKQIADAHARLGTTAILPTLITDSLEKTRAAIAAVREAVSQGLPGIAGLHLEGPHLAKARKGAHDPSLIREMTDADLDMLCAAARLLPALMITVAVEATSPVQIAALTGEGAVVAIGHSDATYVQAKAAVSAGASVVTHLFNAMSQLNTREPGLVGAALEIGALNAGLIADGFHVHPATLGAALRGKRGPGAIFLVSDAMATVGSEMTEFVLNGRRVLRRAGRLMLEDGVLAGADVDLLSTVCFLVDHLNIPLAEAVARASYFPAQVMNLPTFGRLGPGSRADFLILDAQHRLESVWRDGVQISS